MNEDNIGDKVISHVPEIKDTGTHQEWRSL